MTSKKTATQRGAELRMEGITKLYGKSAAVRELDLTVGAGEFVTLLGASGSGKTTTLMMLAGFTLPSSGRIMIGGRDVTSLPPGKRDLGVVFQNYSLFPHLTVAQNLAFPLEMRKVSRKRIDAEVQRVLELVKLPQMASRYPRELSGGQQQRIALARAIIFEPQALLMDEPLGALDKNLREHMQVEIKRLHASLGATVVFVTHDQEEALTMSDRIAVMQDGGIAQIAAPDDIYERPVNRWVAEFIGQSNFLPGTVDATDGDAAIVQLASGERIRMRGAIQPRAGSQVSGVLRPERIRVSRDDEISANQAGNGVRGQVAGILYLGHTLKLEVRLQDGTTLLTQATSGQFSSAPSVGESVLLSWEPDSVWMVPAQEAVS